jgi:hypothetical protein
LLLVVADHESSIAEIEGTASFILLFFGA